jgi:hypothetical protein
MPEKLKVHEQGTRGGERDDCGNGLHGGTRIERMCCQSAERARGPLVFVLLDEPD